MRDDLELYLRLPNYVRTWTRLGYGEDDLADGGSDRLVDAIYALGCVDQVGERLREHLAAGADHVCLRVVTNAPMLAPASSSRAREWRRLAPLVRASARGSRPESRRGRRGRARR